MSVNDDVDPAESSGAGAGRMQAVVRRAHYDPAALRADPQPMVEFERVHAAQPGYAGNVVVDLGGGERILITLWEDEAAATAARTTIGPVVQELLTPVERAPSELLGAGPVLRSDLELVDRGAGD
jgi:hypothetical protein